MGVNWTEEQQQVIRLRDRNILVSAAAGSGKTAVLVERIITRLTEAEPIDVDRLLIVTYTEAAAAEMKERIRDAIEAKLLKDPDDQHLQRQATLIHSAMITTIHSFCLSVIREHFYSIDLDPGFRIAEEGELKLLRQDTMEELLEQRYEDGDQQFHDLTESFGAGRDDKKIEELILQLFDFSRSYPDPQKWLRGCAETYQVADLAALEQSDFMKRATGNIRQYLDDAEARLTEGLTVCDSEDGPHMYRNALESDLAVVHKLQGAETYEQMYETIAAVSWVRLAANRDKSVSADKAEAVKAIRAEVKDSISDIGGQYFFQVPEEMYKDMQKSGRNVRALVELVIDFEVLFAQKKRGRNLIDFSDMEHFALEILLKDEAAVAKEYRSRFAEVMIDEYQDSNLIQEAILTSVSTVDEGRYNVFMVGDVKQSIYRFRLSRPELFMEKFDTYDLVDGQKQRIDLHKNFRSRADVLDSCNFIFEQIMTKELGGITYDEKAALYTGASYPEGSGNETEVLLIDSDTMEEDAQREAEARVVARRIKRLVKEQQIVDKKSGEYRLAEYGDIVILTRSLKGWTDTFLKILDEEGVPATAGTQEGYFKVREVALLLDYLRILDNPRQDIPLAAVLASPFAGLSREELAVIRNYDQTLPFHQAVMIYAEDGEGKLKEKLTEFFRQWEQFRGMVPYMSIHELLRVIIRRTHYAEYMEASSGGEQRRANIEMLVEKAGAFESTSYKGLFNFIRYIEQLKKYDIDYGEAAVSDENGGGVRIMSIHKSKGLEFPIVIVSGMNKLFNTQDTKGSIIIHPELGIGIDAVDLEQRTKCPTLLKKVIQKEVLLENMGEELRVLYVALTRAKEKLIMTGTLPGMDKKIAGYTGEKERRKMTLSFSRLTKARSYYDWVLPALVRNRAFADILETFEIPVPLTNPLYQKAVPFTVTIVTGTDMEFTQQSEQLTDLLTRVHLEEWDTGKVYQKEIRNSLREQFTYQYPHAGKQKQKLKFTVTELKKRSMPAEEAGELLVKDPEVIPLYPRFYEEEQELTGASRGTAYHKVMELLDFTETYQESSIKTQIETWVSQEKMSRQMADCIRPGDIMTFLDSDIGRRMHIAAVKGKLRTEQPFVLGIDEREVYPESTDSELILVQGILDVYFEEEDGFVILDYKTDRVSDTNVLCDRYHEQLRYYKKALEQLTRQPVKGCYIYSFTLKEEIKIEV